MKLGILCQLVHLEEAQGPALICAKRRGQCGQHACTVREFLTPFGIYKHEPQRITGENGKGGCP